MLRTSMALFGVSLALMGCDTRNPYIDDGEVTGPADEISVSGVISQGRRCPLLTGDDGTVYSLAGAEGVSVDHRYEISGLVVDESVCIDGDVAVSVSTVEEVFVEPPAAAPAEEVDPQ